MSRRVEAAAAVLAVAALVLTVLIVGRVSAHGGQAPALLASSPRPRTTPTTRAAALHCDAGPGRSGLVLAGACTGALVAPFGCVSAVDDLYLTGRHQIDEEHVLYLTVNVESYRQHPGDYGGAQAVLQVTGPVTVERWSNYTVNVHVGADRSVTLPATQLTADAGTGSSGTVTAAGVITCEAP
jgi:hypothetical protein